MPPKTKLTSQPNNLNIAVDWYIDCETDEDREGRKRDLLSSTVTANILIKILKRRLSGSDRHKLSDYKENPAWQYELAHRNGQNEELDYLLKLLTSLTHKE